MRKNLHVSFFLLILLGVNCTAMPSQSKEESSADTAFLFSLLSSGNTFAALSSSGTTTTTTTTTTTSSGTTSSASTSSTPSVSSFSPTFGGPGTTLNFSGSNLPTTSSSFAVTINRVAMTSITASTSSSFSAIVPSGVSSGSVVVTINGTASTLSTSFSASPWLNISDNIPTTDTIYRISCPSSNTCFALTQSSSTANTILWRTTNGGTSWTSINTTFSILDVSFGTTFSNLAGGLSCPSVNVCYIVGSKASTPVYKITNASATPTITAQGGNAFGYDINCTSDNFCYSVGVNRIRRTINGGTNWTDEETNTSYMEVSCIGTDTCYVSSSSSTAAFKKITNASAGTPTITTLTATGQSSRASIKCTTANDCFVAGSSPSFAKTSNGGTSWTTTAIPSVSGSTNSFNSIDCLDANNCTMGGNSTSLYRTGDGGSTWSNQGFGTTNVIHQVACASSPAQTCYAVASGGIVLKRTSN